MPVKSALRVLLIIEELAGNPDGLTFAELLRRMDLPRSSLHGLVATLMERDYLTLDPVTKHIRIGLRVWEAGQAFTQAINLERACRPHMEAARDALNEVIHLAVLDGLENVYIAKVEAQQRVVLRTTVGGRLPAHATGLGKALLSGLSDKTLDTLLDGVHLEVYTPNTPSSKEELLQELREVRAKGYARDDGSFDPGVFCIAVPVRDHVGAVVAATSVSIPESRRRSLREAELIRVMKEQGSRMAHALGYKEGLPAQWSE